MPYGSVESLIQTKKETKKSFCKQLGIKVSQPLLGVVLDKELSDHELSTLKNFLEGLAHIDLNVVILSDTNLNLKAVHLNYSRNNRKMMLEAADISLSFSFSDVEEMLLHGTIPISCSRPEVADYNPNRETGNSFIYCETDHWCMFAALVRALETFKFPYDWKNIVRQGLESVLV